MFLHQSRRGTRGILDELNTPVRLVCAHPQCRTCFGLCLRPKYLRTTKIKWPGPRSGPAFSLRLVGLPWPSADLRPRAEYGVTAAVRRYSPLANLVLNPNASLLDQSLIFESKRVSLPATRRQPNRVQSNCLRPANDWPLKN